jgi:hypothetical protein
MVLAPDIYYDDPYDQSELYNEVMPYEYDQVTKF